MPIPPHVAPRLRVDRAKAKTQLAASDPSLNATDAEVDTALAGINQDALYDAARAALRVEVWDRVSPINGVPASHFEQRGDLPATGDVYLLKDADGRVLEYQPHEPDVEGIKAIPVGQGLTRGNGRADGRAADQAAGEVLARVRESILAKRAGA